MRIRSVVVAAVALVCAVAFAQNAFAQDPVGVWKMNPAKSKFSGAAPKSITLTITTASAGSFKSVIDTVPATGAATHSEVTFMFDGKDHPVKGNPNADTQSYTKGADANHWTVVGKKGGKVMITTQVAMAADGKSRTRTQTGIDALGNKVDNMIWDDKQ